VIKESNCVVNEKPRMGQLVSVVVKARPHGKLLKCRSLIKRTICTIDLNASSFVAYLRAKKYFRNVDVVVVDRTEIVHVDFCIRRDHVFITCNFDDCMTYPEWSLLHVFNRKGCLLIEIQILCPCTCSLVMIV